MRSCCTWHASCVATLTKTKQKKQKSFAMPRGTGAHLANHAAKGTGYVRTTIFHTLGLTESYFLKRDSALVRAVFHHSRGSHFSGGQLCSSRQGTAVATCQVPFPGCFHCMPSVSTYQCLTPSVISPFWGRGWKMPSYIFLPSIY